MQAIAWNCRNQCSDANGEVQAAKTARREYRSGALGGPTRRSDEGSVMGLEQRGRVRLWHHRNNWQQDELDACDKQTIQYR
jgi:hypothetical protein